MNILNNKIIKENLAIFENGIKEYRDDGRKPWARYASFDYCFNYFQGFKNKKDIANKSNIQNSCLHLAFYLASWGMLRGSSFLLQKSIKFYEPLIKFISEQEESFWKIDVSNYSEDNIYKILECKDNIKEILSNKEDNNVTDTLITKIMLGIFGSVPAFDSYFKTGSNLKTFNKKSLEELKSFYDSNSETIIIEANKIKTFDYNTGKSSPRRYTEAKIIDMIFFMEGIKNIQKNDRN